MVFSYNSNVLTFFYNLGSIRTIWIKSGYTSLFSINTCGLKKINQQSIQNVRLNRHVLITSVMGRTKKIKHKSSSASKPKWKETNNASANKSCGIITNHSSIHSNTVVSTLPDNGKKKTARRKKKKSIDSVSQITDSFAKLDVNSKSAKSSKKLAKNHPTIVPNRHRSHSAGSTRSNGHKMESLEDIARYIKEGRAKNIIVMCGAGISTASGIPDFRTPGTGLYHNLQKYNIPTPTAVFDLDYFRYKPKPFFELAKELYPTGKYRPNLAHYFLRSLHEKGLLLRLYTQNIDGLERLAGIPSSKLVEAHGTFSTASCTKCGKKYDGEKIKDKIFKNVIPRCDIAFCWGVIKPDIVFFGEDLPKRFYYYLKDFPLCDLLIVMGTSLEVEPFASLMDSVRYNVPRLLINRDIVGPFKKCRKSTDAIGAGDMVEVVDRFATLLGWKRFVQETMSNHEKLYEMEAPSDVQTDSGVSSASSETEQREAKKTETLPPPSGNIKRYFHTIRSTPLPKSKSRLPVADSKEPSSIPTSLSYFDYIRNTSKPPKSQDLASGTKPSARQLLDSYTFAKSKAPKIEYAQKIERPNSKLKPNRKLSCASVPCRPLDFDSSDSQSESSSSDSSSEF